MSTRISVRGAMNSVGLDRGGKYREAGRAGPDAVAGDADDGGLVDVAGADEAVRISSVFRFSSEAPFRYRVGLSAECGWLPGVNISCAGEQTLAACAPPVGSWERRD